MRFEERELKPYSEPVSPDELQIDETYFTVLFLDTNGDVPVLEPRVFIGRNLEPADEEKLYVQDSDRWVKQLREVRRAERARAVPRLWWSLAVTSASCVRAPRR
jgi:hypothetical protein